MVPTSEFPAALDALVERFLALPLTSVSASKRLIARAFDLDLETFRRTMETEFKQCLASDDHRRAMEAIRRKG